MKNKKSWLTKVLIRSRSDPTSIIEKTKIKPIMNNRIIEINKELEKLNQKNSFSNKRSNIKIKSKISGKGQITKFRKKDLKKEQIKISKLLTRSKEKNQKNKIEKSEELRRIESEISKLRKKLIKK